VNPVPHSVLNLRMLKKAAFSPAEPQRAKPRCSTGKAAASEEARCTLRYVEPLREARTPLADFFSVLLIFRCSPSLTSAM
jgi:hypothetical protein